MELTTHTNTAGRELRTVKILIGFAVMSLLTAALAGLVLLTIPPDGSTIEGALGFTAAGAGLATAGFSIAAAIYAQVKDLWRYAPNWIRQTLWVVVALAVTATVLNVIDQIL